MPLLERLKRWHDVVSLRRRARRAPSPSAWAELAERLVTLGRIDDALAAAEEGLEVFPDSERLAHVRLFSKKGRLQGRIRRLKDEVERRPNPQAYAQLAALYRELGSHDEALAVAAECAERFPLNDASFLVLGEIRVERFLRDRIARDALVAEEALAKVVRLNPHNARGHLLLAQLHWLVGDAATARRQLADVLAVNPAAREVEAFLAAGGDAGDDAEPPAPFEELAGAVEARGAFVNEPESFPAPGGPGQAAQRSRGPLDAVHVANEVSHFGATEGVRNVLVIDRDGHNVSDVEGPGGMASARFAALVAAVRDTADEAARRMDTGALVRAEIEGPQGNLTVVRAGGLTFALLWGEPLRSEAVWESVQDFVAKHLAPGREAARA